MDNSRKRTTTALIVLLLAGVLGAVALLWHWRAGPAVPNVILITVDTLRADHLGAYGYRRATSPNIDAFARESILYHRGFAQAPETNPSLSSLMTSQFPHETQVFRNYHQLQQGVTTVAELLRARGWRTGAVVSNYSLRRGSGFEQGFDDYDDRMEDKGTPKWEGVERVAPKTTAAAIEWLQRHAKDRFFFWVHYMDPHAPYVPPPPYDSMFSDPASGAPRTLRFLEGGTGTGGIPAYAQLGTNADYDFYVSRYDGEIRYLDVSFGELHKAMRELGLLENTLVIVTADHGEGMGEHEYYFNHLEFVYTGLIHVPLLVRLPAGTRGGEVVRTPVALVDVLPTILNVLQLEVPARLKGQSLLEPQARAILSAAHIGPAHAALMKDGMKLIMRDGHPWLYDLEQDFYETNDLLQSGGVEQLTLAKNLKETLLTIALKDDVHLGEPVNWTILSEDIKRLKALGYVQ